MEIFTILENITNPALMFFILGIISTQLKSDLEIPESSSKFISSYLLLSIGFKGGQELSHSTINIEIINSMFFGILLSLIIPVVTFFILRLKRFSIENAGAIAATYGSISAVTFVTTISFLEYKGITFGGHMIAVMALMEAPAIIIGFILINSFKKKDKNNLTNIIKHSITNASVLLIIGSLIIGYIASDAQAEGIKPFTTDIFKGFLAVFLLDMGISCGKRLSAITKNGIFPIIFAIIMPFVFGLITLFFSQFISDSVGNRLLLTILAASASYIAVPATMKQNLPDANIGLYLPMALAITFPINIIFGISFYYYLLTL